jgi:hypothetical protein
MYASIQPVFTNGIPIKRGDLASVHAREGELIITEEADPRRKRTVRVARVNRIDRKREPLFMPLWDVSLVAVGVSWMTISGYEEVSERLCAQTWLVKFEVMRP